MLTTHAALVLTIATIIGLVIGSLMYISTHEVATATIAGLGALGLSIPILRREIGN
ncbi:hypothetical protein [Streptomyces zaomyceticus]|uniref:hypothetical protein n=1 Tax=Streptomyces zaomyceticus TaxID=68286 RepID=UPI00378BDCF0